MTGKPKEEIDGHTVFTRVQIRSYKRTSDKLGDNLFLA